MTVGLDTSVVLRLLLGEPQDQAQRAGVFVAEATRRGDRLVVSDLVVAEAYFALQYHYGVPKKEALGALRRMLADGEIGCHGMAAEVLATVGLASVNPGFVDRLIHRAYLADGGSMATFEKASAKLPSVRVV